MEIVVQPEHAPASMRTETLRPKPARAVDVARPVQALELPPMRGGLSTLLFVVILFAGLWMRGDHLARIPPTGDESESAINALTILQTGLPRGTYLGLPIYENVLTEPWSGHPEYEFRDSSYSKHDLAIYHGWLPLYSIALSFKAMGIRPDEVSGELGVRHSEAEIRRRVIAARAPAVVFGGAFMIFLFLAGREMFGADAGWSAMLVGSIGRPFVYMGREARYHSATLAITTACCWAFWRVYQRGRWIDYVVAAVCLSLLFYTHLLAFMIASAMFGLVVLARIRRPQELRRVILAGAIVAACALPWIVGSGFLDQRAHIPPARVFLTFPLDLIWFPVLNVPYLVLPLLMLGWILAVLFLHRKLPQRLVQPLAERRWEIVFLTCWIAFGLLAFTLLIPAASYFYKRLTLPVLGIGVVWGAVVISAAVRSASARLAVVLAPLVFAVTVVLGNMGHLWFLEKADRLDGYIAIERLREQKIAPDTKLYCTPNEQLTLVFLAGLPVQSVAPIRKSFIDDYSGPILMIDSSRPYGRLDEDRVRGIAWQNGFRLTRAEAEREVGPCYMRAMREYVAPLVASVDPPAEPEPPFAEAVVQSMRTEMDMYLRQFYQRGTNTPLLRRFELRDWSDWWPLFFYRFVDPELRMRDNLNYADRIRSARAECLPSGWVFFHCPPKEQVKELAK